ncbi:hypothetical protein EKO04_003963 [Ascochyta lentis]|uniref:Uncharacterized protein n=1 Tax=Ascochyta lentis TaxID=205686 RepID=A0A8H7MIG6_9PLEO|nr:hypothetical protein EKO04_003963 [Ascochyta lentis]
MTDRESFGHEGTLNFLDKSRSWATENDKPKGFSKALSFVNLFTPGPYLRLDQDQSETPRHVMNHRPLVLILCLVAVAASACAGGAAGYIAAATADCVPHLPQRSSLGSCGHNSSSCVYDFVMGSWIHSRCFDEELNVKYVEQARQLNLTYYANPDGTTEVSLDVALRGEHSELWTSGGQHHLHCAYFWEKQLKVWKHGGSAWDTDTLSEEHTLHCILLNSHPSPRELLNATITKVYAPDKPIECIVI